MLSVLLLQPMASSHHRVTVHLIGIGCLSSVDEACSAMGKGNVS